MKKYNKGDRVRLDDEVMSHVNVGTVEEVLDEIFRTRYTVRWDNAGFETYMASDLKPA